MADGIEASLIQDFIEESSEQLVAAESCLVSCESGQYDEQQVSELFRLLHSLKGNAALFSCDAMKLVAHDAEHLLDYLRGQRHAPSAAMVDALLQVLDFFSQLLQELRHGRQWPSGDQRVLDLRNMLSNLHHQARQGADPLQHALSIARDMLPLVDEDSPALREALHELMAVLQPGLGGAQSASAGPLGLLRSILATPIEDSLSDDHCLQIEAALQDLRSAARDPVAAAIAEECWDGYQIFSQSVGFDETLRDYLWQRLERATMEGQWAWQGTVNEGVAAAKECSVPGAETAEVSADIDHHKTMRVSEEHIDTFLAFVGDLLVIGDTFHHLQRRLVAGVDVHALSRDFHRANESFQVLSGKLQDSIMTIRQVPADVLLRRAPRLVRDVARAQDKAVECRCVGHDLRLDKSLVELLDAPLTHLLRNAVDHGVEAPDQRQGKPAQAVVEVRLQAMDKQIQLQVSDDGRGLDRDAIRRSAVARGLIAADKELDDEDIVRIICAAGMSTAQEVSEISGRGVGLDVVHATIVNAGGSVRVESVTGQGTTFTVTLPISVTTQIIMGFLVSCENQTLVLPMERVVETLRYDPRARHRVGPGCSVLACHDRNLPLAPLAGIYGIDHESILGDDQRAQVAVRCRISGERECVLVVDAVLGVQQVVLRPIDGLRDSKGLISGGALLGDGSVSLIVDVDAICRGLHDREATASGAVS